MKIDCNITENYLKEQNRMIRNCEIDCKDCPISSYNNGYDLTCAEFKNTYPDKAIEIVQKWSDENQPETRAEHFMKMFPNALIHKTKNPSACVKRLNKNIECKDECIACWNKPYTEGEF